MFPEPLLAAGAESSFQPLLVQLAIGTTLMATPLATRLLRGSPHEAALVANGFLTDPKSSARLPLSP